MYRIQSLAILAGLVGLFAIVGYALFGGIGVLLILVSAVLINSLTMGSAVRFILSVHRARPLGPGEAPYLHDIARTLSSRAGIAVPRLAVYPSDIPNAFTLPPQENQSIVAVSSGLLRLLQPQEIAGVMAHEFAHLKNRDSRFSLSAGVFVQSISILANTFGLLFLFLFFSGAWVGTGSSLLPILLLIGVAPLAAQALQAGLMRTRERLADRDGALLTGDPRSLASGLYKLEQYSRYLQGLQKRFRFLYTSENEGGSAWLRTHPDTEERIRNLLELEKKTLPHPAAFQRADRFTAVR